MARTPATRAEAIEQLIVEYEQSGMTRQRYCDLRGIPVSTFDYYRRRRQEQQQSKNAGHPQQLVRVEVSRPAQQHAERDRKLQEARSQRQLRRRRVA